MPSRAAVYLVLIVRVMFGAGPLDQAATAGQLVPVTPPISAMVSSNLYRERPGRPIRRSARTAGRALAVEPQQIIPGQTDTADKGLVQIRLLYSDLQAATKAKDL